MPKILKELIHNGEFIVSEANHSRSREQIVLKAGANYLPGTILGEITDDKKFVAINPAATDGSEVATAILWAAKDTTDNDQDAVVITRSAEVQASLLTWPANITDTQKEAAISQLESRQVILR